MARPAQSRPAQAHKEDFQEAEPILFTRLEDRIAAGPDPCRVPVEAPLTIDVKDVGAFTVMSSPGEALALAVGFVYSEGLISSRDDINLLQRCVDDPSVIRIQLAAPPKEGRSGRNLIVASSCGMCGAQNLDEVLDSLPKVGRTLSLPASEVLGLIKVMEQEQALYEKTGGTHAAAILDGRGRVLSLAEDMGRHNALDKAVGKMILEGRSPAGCLVTLSGRVSLEMAVKSARAGLEMIVAVSSPTSLALEAARRCGITVCAFVRKGRATVFTHPERIQGLAEAAAEGEG